MRWFLVVVLVGCSGSNEASNGGPTGGTESVRSDSGSAGAQVSDGGSGGLSGGAGGSLAGSGGTAPVSGSGGELAGGSGGTGGVIAGSGGALAGAGGSGGAVGGAGGSQDAGPVCQADRKWCDPNDAPPGCVEIDNPAFGCGVTGCTRCEWNDVISGGHVECASGQCLAVCPDPKYQPNALNDGCELIPCASNEKRCSNGGPCEPITAFNGCDPSVSPPFSCQACTTIGDGTCDPDGSCPD